MQADERQARVLCGQWWRFGAYELVGRRIRPTGGASLERYDPWERRSEAPYVALARLGEQIRDWYRGQVQQSLARFREMVVAPPEPTPAELRAYIEQAQAALAGAYAQSVELPEEIAGLLTAWCRAHGLLGIFAQETLAVNLHARPEALLDLLDELPEDHLLARYVRYERAGSGWRTLSVLQRVPVEKGSHPELARRSLPELVRSTDWPLTESRLEPATVLRRSLPAKPGLSAALDLIEFDRVTGAYLGEGRGDDFPVPDSDEFWRAYGEDVVEFAGYAVALAEVLSGVQQTGVRQRAAHRERFNELLAPVSLMLTEETAGLRARFAAPSLIATLAAMAFFDIAGGMRIAHCERCRRLFATRRADRRFCSPVCQEYAKSKRRYQADAAHRARQRAAARARMQAQRAERA